MTMKLRTLLKFACALTLAAGIVLAGGCDATTSGVRQPSSPFPYNPGLG